MDGEVEDFFKELQIVLDQMTKECLTVHGGWNAKIRGNAKLNRHVQSQLEADIFLGIPRVTGFLRDGSQLYY